MSLTKPAIDAVSPQRRTQELLNEWLKVYFATGGTFKFPEGDRAFPACDLLFNQTDLPAGQQKVQLLCLFTDWRERSCWWANGKLGDWEEMLANPASGVSYGRTSDGYVEESVHGKRLRRIAGTSIRWTTSGGDLLEEVLMFNGTWQTVRMFPGITAIRWRRSSTGATYTEETSGDDFATTATSNTERVVVGTNDVWDGTVKQVQVSALLTFYFRKAYQGADHHAADFEVRTAAECFAALTRNARYRAPLMEKGFRGFTLERGPTVLPSSGYATQLCVVSAKANYWLPVEGIS